MQDDLGDRMKKNYENRYRLFLTRRTPVIIRVDGRCFSQFTRRFDRPFDLTLRGAMVAAAEAAGRDMQGFKLAYVQSDEASFLLTDYDKHETEAWFDYNKSKIETIAASTFTAFFNAELWRARQEPYMATFDARAFNVPREEVTNYFLWRVHDWVRNSLMMYARSYFSHAELDGKTCEDVHEMLHGRGKNWAKDLEPRWKNGSLVLQNVLEVSDFRCTFDGLSSFLDPVVNVDELLEAAS